MELKLRHVTKRYGTKTAVDDVSMTLREGIYGLLGANGAGKTSLMRLICMIQNRSGGEITLNGKEIIELKENTGVFLGISRRILAIIRNLPRKNSYSICLR